MNYIILFDIIDRALSKADIVCLREGKVLHRVSQLNYRAHLWMMKRLNHDDPYRKLSSSEG